MMIRYEVEDEDPEEQDKRWVLIEACILMILSRHFVSTSEIIPLQEEKKELPVGTAVLAIFPNTTSFYNAIISSPPKYGVVCMISFD
jgi:hypothetical protein